MNKKIIWIVDLALYVAMYVVLKYIGNLIPFLQMPNGGSIELELIAVFLASYQLGWKGGLAAALLSWLITIVLGFNMWIVSPMQTILDYVAPLIVCGLASALWPFRNMKKTGVAIFSAALGIAVFFGIYYSFSQTVGAVISGIAVAAVVIVFAAKYPRAISYYGVAVAMILKYISQMLSGVYFWFPEGSAAGSAEAWAFSATYNLWYNLVTLAICIILVPLLADRLKKAGIKFIA